MRKRPIRSRPIRIRTGDRRLHSQRHENLLTNVIVPTFSAHFSHHLASRNKHQIVVSKAGPEAARRLQKAHTVNHVLPRKRRMRPEHEVAFAKPQPASMTKQVANPHLLGDIRVIHLEAFQSLVHRVVPRNFSFVDQSRSAAAVNALVFEPMANTVFSSTGAGSPSFRTPYPFASTNLPSL